MTHGDDGGRADGQARVAPNGAHMTDADDNGTQKLSHNIEDTHK